MRPYTLGERRRLYLLARLMVKRRYREPLTLGLVAKMLASSPRQIQRVYAQFGSATFRDDLLARRMIAAAELLSQPAIPVRDVGGWSAGRLPPAIPLRTDVPAPLWSFTFGLSGRVC
jgi:transcriptional regulator GlxA family with amidase domain